MKTPNQIAADKRHRALSLRQNRDTPRNTPQFVIALRSTASYRDWNKHNER